MDQSINFIPDGPGPKSQPRIKLRYQLATFFLIALIIAGLFQGAHLIAAALGVKSDLAITASEALKHIKEAQSLVAEKDFVGSEQEFRYAENNFLHAQEQLSQMGALFNSGLALTQKGQSVSALLDAGEHASRAGTQLNQVFANLASIRVSPTGARSDSGVYATLQQVRAGISDVKAELAIVQNDMLAVSVGDLPQEYQSDFGQYKDTLDTLIDGVDHVYNLLGLLQGFFGTGSEVGFGFIPK